MSQNAKDVMNDLKWPFIARILGPRNFEGFGRGNPKKVWMISYHAEGGKQHE